MDELSALRVAPAFFALALGGLASPALAAPMESVSGIVLSDPKPQVSARWIDVEGRAVTTQGCFDLSVDPALPVGAAFDLSNGVLVTSPTSGELAFLVEVDDKTLELRDFDCDTGLGPATPLDLSSALPDTDELFLMDPTTRGPDGTLYLRVLRRSSDSSMELLALDPDTMSVTPTVTSAELDALLLDELRLFRPLVAAELHVESADVPLRAYRIYAATAAPNGNLWLFVGWSELPGGPGPGGAAKWLWIVEREADGTLIKRMGPETSAFHPSHFAYLDLQIAPTGRYQRPFVYDRTLEAMVLGWPTVRGSNESDEQMDSPSLAVLPVGDPGRANLTGPVPPFIDISDAHNMWDDALWTLVGVDAGPTLVNSSDGLRELGFDFERLDADRDGLTWAVEEQLGTSDLATDSDLDGVNDGFEERVLGRSPLVADASTEPTHVYAPSTLIHDWTRLEQVDEGDGKYLGPRRATGRSYHQDILCPLGGNNSEQPFWVDASETLGPLCLDSEGAWVFDTPPESHPWFGGFPNTGVFGPSGRYVFEFRKVSNVDPNSQLLRVDTQTWAEQTLLTDPFGGFIYPLTDEQVLRVRGQLLERVSLDGQTHVVVDPEREACIFQPTPESPCEPLHGRYDLFIALNPLGYDPDLDAHLFELTGRTNALVVAVGTNWGEVILDRRHLPNRANAGSIVGRPGEPRLVASGALLDPNLGQTGLPQPGSYGEGVNTYFTSWFRDGFTDHLRVPTLSRLPKIPGGGCVDTGNAFDCSPFPSSTPQIEPVTVGFQTQWSPMPAERIEAGEVLLWAADDNATHQNASYVHPEIETWMLWRIGVAGGVLPWLDDVQMWARMDPSTRSLVDATPLAEITDIGVAPDLSEVCLVETENNRIWRIQLDQGEAILVELASETPEPGGCAYDDQNRLGIYSAAGLTIDGDSADVEPTGIPGPLTFIEDTWVVLDKTPDSFPYATHWLPARCVEPGGEVVETAPMSAVASAPGGALWLQSEPFDVLEESIYLAGEHRDRAIVGDLDALCHGEGRAELLVATTRPQTGVDPVPSTDRILWDWWYREEAALTGDFPRPVIADGASLAMRDDGIVFVAPIRAHFGASEAENQPNDTTRDVLFRLRGEFKPLDPERPLPAVDAFRQKYPRMRVHWYRPYEIRAMVRVPGGVHDHDYRYLGMEPPSLEGEDEGGGDETGGAANDSGDDRGCNCASGDRHSPLAPLVLFVGLIAWRRRGRAPTP